MIFRDERIVVALTLSLDNMAAQMTKGRCLSTALTDRSKYHRFRKSRRRLCNWTGQCRIELGGIMSWLIGVLLYCLASVIMASLIGQMLREEKTS